VAIVTTCRAGADPARPWQCRPLARGTGWLCARSFSISAGDGSRQPSENELAGARHQGDLIAKTVIKLFG